MTLGQISAQQLLDNYVPNEGDSCTSAAVLNSLAALGAQNLPDLAEVSAAISGVGQFQAPRITDYVGIPFLRRAPLDSRIEQLAASHGLKVRSETRLSLVPSKVVPLSSNLTMPGAGETLIGHMAWGQERPGVWGSWGFELTKMSDWNKVGHSVIIASAEGSGWAVIDSDNAGIQHWTRPGWAMATTTIQVLE
jgi:hypothetical protein